jgi:hypothetical protein
MSPVISFFMLLENYAGLAGGEKASKRAGLGNWVSARFL